MAGGLAPRAGGGRRRRGRITRAPMAEINVTPMVDVMLVLLVIFMVTAPLLSAGVPISLPDSKARALDHPPQEITITLARDGGIYLDTTPVTRNALAARIAALPPGPDGKPPAVTLRADKALDYGAVVAVMGELNNAGIGRIALVTGQGAGEGGAGGPGVVSTGSTLPAALTPGSAGHR